MTDQAGPRHSVVLVVDDAADMRDLLKMILEDKGYEVRLAANGAEALQSLSERHFDAVLTDMWMPEMTGAQFIVAARADPTTSGLHIIMMSGSFEQGFPKDVDADDFLKKPLDIQPLLDILAKVSRTCA